MKGKHKIRLATPRETYDFTINRKVTIIRGDSGTGKSMLCKAVKMSGRTGFILDCDVECNSADDSRYWKEIIKNSSGTIWFIDEDFIYLETKEFARLVKDTDNYFVIISRKPLAYIPYSYIEIYKIKSNTKRHFNTLERIYDIQYNKSCPDLIITEDSKSGYEFFRAVAGNNVISAEGNANICRIAKTLKDKETLIVADGAAIGNYIDSIFSLKANNDNIKLFLPESFEYLLLNSDLFSNDKELQKILKNPVNYITTEFLTWEQFFTKLIIDLMASIHGREYSKSKLSLCFIEKCCTNKEICGFYHNTPDKFEMVMKNYDMIDFSKIKG